MSKSAESTVRMLVVGFFSLISLSCRELPNQGEAGRQEQTPPPPTRDVLFFPDELRAEDETVNTFVDQYSVRMWGLLIWIAAMNAGDTFFTLLHLQGGGIELNPVAELMLETGRLGFVALKSFLITLPLVVLCLHKNFSLARLGLWIVAGTYTVLLAYHVSLL